jgi:uncharacterized protein YcbK (DUF882 family)/LysM repeat protein
MQFFTLKTGASRLRSLAPAALAAILATIVPHYARGAEIVHVVAKGQTLGRIAKRYHTTVEAIREVNNLKRGERLHPGLSLVIPEKGKEAEAAKKAAQLQAKSGDGKKGQGAKGKAEGKAKKGGKGKDGDDEGPGNYARRPKKPGFIHLARGSEKLETQLLGRHGKLSPPALAGLSKILHGPSGEKIAIDPRLATLIGMVSDHFGGRTIRVVSGYRPYSPAQYTPHSNHNVGRAMDFAVEGVPNTVVRDFCRSFRNAGVGYYPNSTFVHLDVRSGKSYWVDYSRPGEPPRYEGSHAPADADEAAGDVEPHAGAGEAGTPGADPAPGSN